jgi:hypothetical protein
VTSHFFTTSSADINLIAFNYRGRLKVLDQKEEGVILAGNYTGEVMYDKEHSSPADIRAAYKVQPDGSYSSAVDTFPGFCGTTRTSFITNWASLGGSATNVQFYLKVTEDAHLTQLLHLPALVHMEMGIRRVPLDTAIVYYALPNQLAVLYVAKWGAPKDLVDSGKDTILGKSISTKIFPEGPENIDDSKSVITN